MLVFHKPRPLALFTGRHAVKYHWEPDLDKLWRELSEMGATHIVLPKYIDPAMHREYYFPGIIERYRQNLELLFENPSYAVYRICTGIGSASPVSGMVCVPVRLTRILNAHVCQGRAPRGIFCSQCHHRTVHARRYVIHTLVCGSAASSSFMRFDPELPCHHASTSICSRTDPGFRACGRAPPLSCALPRVPGRPASRRIVSSSADPPGQLIMPGSRSKDRCSLHLRAITLQSAGCTLRVYLPIPGL